MKSEMVSEMKSFDVLVERVDLNECCCCRCCWFVDTVLSCSL